MTRLPFAATPLCSVRFSCQLAEIRQQNCPASSALGSPSLMVFGLLFKAGDSPWQKFLPPFLGEKTAPDEHRCQIALRVKLVGYGGEYEGVVELRSLGPADRSTKKVIFSAYYDRLDALPFGHVVRGRQVGVLEIAGNVLPLVHYSGTRIFDKSGVACYAPPACIRLPRPSQHGGLPCPENVELLRPASKATSS